MSAVRGKLTPIAILGQHRKDADIEAWIAKRLDQPGLFEGVTSREMRRDRLKVVLLKRELVESIAGRFDGKPITWRAIYQKLYGEALA